MKRRFFSVFVALALCLSLLPGTALAEGTDPWEGSGTSAQDPYLIKNAEHLKVLAEAVNDGESYSGKFFKIEITGDSIDLGNIDWTPIGKDGTPFKGTFDGNGKTISGLNVTGNTGGYYGLFGCIGTGGTVQNLAVSGSVSVNTTAQVWVGGIVGYCYGTIQSCQFSGSVSGSGGDYSCFGGVAGNVLVSVSNCYNTGNVSGSGNVGGVVGYALIPIQYGYNTGSVSDTSANNNSKVGGVAGVATSPVINCFYLKNTAVKGVGDGHPGATEIDAAAFAEKTTFTGWDFTENTGDWVMGPFGRPLLAWETASASADGSENNPYQIASVFDLEQFRERVNNDATNATYGSKYYQLTADLDLKSITNWTPIGTESNNAFAGVFDGKGHTVSNLAIDVTAAGNYGLFGYSTGTVQNLAVNGSVSVTNADPVNVGGILGCNAGTLQSCYYTGTVSGPDGSSVGRVIGTVDSGTTSNCFYLLNQDETAENTKGISTGNVAGQVEAASTDRFGSGEVAWNLQNGQTTQIWGQTIQTDNFPVPTSDKTKKVYQVDFQDNSTGESYTNYAYAYANSGGTVTLPTDLSKEGYALSWFTAQTGGTEFTAETPVTKDTTLYSRWTLNQYTVTFDPANGDTTSTEKVDHGKTVSKPDPDPAKSDHTFDGWYNGDETTQFDFSTPITSDLTLTAHWTPIPSGGGSSRPSTPSITVPVSSETGSVTVKATVKNGNACVEISDKQINQVVAEGAKNVTVDLTGLKNVTSATLPAHVIETIGNAEDVGLTVALPTGTVSLDSTALSSLPAGEDITVSVKRVPATDLNEQQQAAVGDMANIGLVFDVEILVNGEQHTDLNGGTVTISIPYTPKKGENPHKMTVWYIRDDGMIMPMGGYYDEENQCFVFEARELPLRVS